MVGAPTLPRRARLRTVVPARVPMAPVSRVPVGTTVGSNLLPPGSRLSGHGRGEDATRGVPTREELIALQGQIVKGKVVRLEEYGAFVEIATEDGGAVTGLVHVSEVDADFVENIYAYLAEGDEVDVKVLDVKEDGKVDLSIKRADPEWQDEEVPNLRSKLDKDFNKRLRRFMHKSQMIQGEARRQKRGRVGS
jgi:predicted RNA-binding protein with RPS1 domain